MAIGNGKLELPITEASHAVPPAGSEGAAVAAAVDMGREQVDLTVKHSDHASNTTDNLFLPPAPYGDSKVGTNAIQKTGDIDYQKLKDQERLAQKGGPQLSEADQAALLGYELFPAKADSKYRDLARRESLSIDHAGPALSPAEDAVLSSTRPTPFPQVPDAPVLFYPSPSDLP